MSAGIVGSQWNVSIFCQQPMKCELGLSAANEMSAFFCQEPTMFKHSSVNNHWHVNYFFDNQWNFATKLSRANDIPWVLVFLSTTIGLFTFFFIYQWHFSVLFSTTRPAARFFFFVSPTFYPLLSKLGSPNVGPLLLKERKKKAHKNSAIFRPKKKSARYFYAKKKSAHYF